MNALIPDNWPVESDWTAQVGSFFETEEAATLFQFVDGERTEHRVFPERQNVFRAFQLTGFAETKVVILGQDPYHGAGQAHGLSFSVQEGVKLPPSLRNIFKELVADSDSRMPTSGDLTPWAAQGVLLLNTVLTVRESKAGSHRGKGWEAFTDLVISKLSARPRGVVFVLWGKPAEKKSKLIAEKHPLIVSPHPSPLSAHRGFVGSRPFAKINAALKGLGHETIDWML